MRALLAAATAFVALEAAHLGFDFYIRLANELGWYEMVDPEADMTGYVIGYGCDNGTGEGRTLFAFAEDDLSGCASVEVR